MAFGTEATNARVWRGAAFRCGPLGDHMRQATFESGHESRARLSGAGCHAHLGTFRRATSVRISIVQSLNYSIILAIHSECT